VHQAEIRKQTEKLSREFGTTAREELLKNSERMRQQMRELRLEISGGLDI
jgi:hypothetical protein